MSPPRTLRVPSSGKEYLETGFIGNLRSLNYEYRPDIRDRAAPEENFREKFEALNRVHPIKPDRCGPASSKHAEHFWEEPSFHGKTRASGMPG